MGKWVHVLSDFDDDAGTVTCENCGIVPVHWRLRKGVRVRICSVSKKESERSKSTGLTKSETKGWVEGKTCQICGTAEDLVPDHCHRTNRLREPLCRLCNCGLGMFRDDPALMRAAAKYVERHAVN